LPNLSTKRFSVGAKRSATVISSSTQVSSSGSGSSGTSVSSVLTLEFAGCKLRLYTTRSLSSQLDGA
ncbi:hypothetical protein A2U01_0043605, partial [Trifolium medium]|nr:hypothetical protein [Trifolium medium]